MSRIEVDGAIAEVVRLAKLRFSTELDLALERALLDRINELYEFGEKQEGNALCQMRHDATLDLACGIQLSIEIERQYNEALDVYAQSVARDGVKPELRLILGGLD